VTGSKNIIQTLLSTSNERTIDGKGAKNRSVSLSCLERGANIFLDIHGTTSELVVWTCFTVLVHGRVLFLEVSVGSLWFENVSNYKRFVDGEIDCIPHHSHYLSGKIPLIDRISVKGQYSDCQSPKEYVLRPWCCFLS
jgi:hypothetical protein